MEAIQSTVTEKMAGSFGKRLYILAQDSSMVSSVFNQVIAQIKENNFLILRYLISLALYYVVLRVCGSHRKTLLTVPDAVSHHNRN